MFDKVAVSYAFAEKVCACKCACEHRSFLCKLCIFDHKDVCLRNIHPHNCQTNKCRDRGQKFQRVITDSILHLFNITRLVAIEKQVMIKVCENLNPNSFHNHINMFKVSGMVIFKSQ